jgi:hypothetical protein
MPRYQVLWEIDVEADSPGAAAQEAFEAMQAPETTATFFTVIETDSAERYTVELRPPDVAVVRPDENPPASDND